MLVSEKYKIYPLQTHELEIKIGDVQPGFCPTGRKLEAPSRGFPKSSLTAKRKEHVTLAVTEASMIERLLDNRLHICTQSFQYAIQCIALKFKRADKIPVIFREETRGFRRQLGDKEDF